MLKFLFVGLSVLLLSSPSFAYKLRLHTVVNKMIKNSGRPGSGYHVNREINFEHGGKTIKAKEEWWVKSSDRMKVRVQSIDSNPPWSFEIAYNGKTRQTLSSSKNVKTYQNSPEFFEPLFFERSPSGMLDRLESFRFIPSWAKKIQAPDYVNGKTIMKDENFVGLAPSQGSVNYTLGAARTTTGDKGETFLFIEQDSWRITKGKLNSTSEFKNKEFQSVDGGLQLPRTQIVSWSDRAARLRLISAKKTKISEAQLALASTGNSNIPNLKVVKEFYSRFR